MNHDAYPDNYIREILNSVKSIAMVGASPVNVRPSYFAFKYLAQRGYDMIPVNPGHVGKSLLEKPFVASLADIGRPVDMIDIFRNSSHIMPVVEEALKLDPATEGDLDATRGARRCRRRESGSRRHQGGDEPLPENRVWKAVLGNFLDGGQFAHVEFQARADPDPGHAAVAQSRERRRRRDRRVRPRREEQDPTLRDAMAKQLFPEHGRSKHGSCSTAAEARAALTADAAATSMPREFTTKQNRTHRMTDRLPGFLHPRRACRRAARSDHRRAGDADLSDHVVRVQRCRPRRLAVRTAGVRQHLYPHRQPDQRGAGRARRGAGRRHGGAGGGLRPRRAGRRAAAIADARRRIHRRAKTLWRFDQSVHPRLQEFWLERGMGRSR